MTPIGSYAGMEVYTPEGEMVGRVKQPLGGGRFVVHRVPGHRPADGARHRGATEHPASH